LPSAESHGLAPDIALVSRIVAGDEAAMAQLYDRHASIVYAVALRVLGDTEAAEDVLQEVFLQFWRNPSVYDSSRGRLGAWLAVIARNRAVDSLRKRRPEIDIEDVVVSVQTDFADSAERGRYLGRIRSALDGMSKPQRSALEMAFFEGMTHTEIALKTGEPLGTIKTRIRSGVLSLREALSV
jgi:RNA polymerase sigma-70 factor (ECF subfamily)